MWVFVTGTRTFGVSWSAAGIARTKEAPSAGLHCSAKKLLKKTTELKSALYVPMDTLDRIGSPAAS